MTNLKNAIEAILFVAGNPVSAKTLSKILEVPEEKIASTIADLKQDLENRGLVISETSKSYQLATRPELSPQVKKYLQSELREKLTDASIETLSIIAYKQPVSRAEIEAIRGVNSQYIIKLLLQRGLIEKVPHPSDARMFLYQITHEFLHHLGIASVADLPDFEQLTAHLKSDGEINTN